MTVAVPIPSPGISMSHDLSRRAFLGGSLAGLASCKMLSAADPTADMTAAVGDEAKEKKEKDPDPPAFVPAALSTLFLTWQRDPTTTMTVQWVGAEADWP